MPSNFKVIFSLLNIVYNKALDWSLISSLWVTVAGLYNY